MKQFTHLLIPACTAFLILTGCAKLDDDNSNPPGDDSVCQMDCDGPDLSVPPPEGSGTWACRSFVDRNGQDYMAFKAMYLNAGSEPTASIVGKCPSEGIVGYWTGTYVQVDNDSGWYVLPLAGISESCTLTYSVCSDTSNPTCWAQFGLGTFPEGSGVPGPFRDCREGSCGCTFSRNPGGLATPFGDN